MKQEVNSAGEIESIASFSELEREINLYMASYSNHSPQCNLKKLIPVEHRNQPISSK